MSERRLDKQQLEYFRRDETVPRATEYKRLVKLICGFVESRPSLVRIADLGGGDGRILDGCLDALPNAKGVLLDVAQEMVDANRSREDKQVLRGDLADVDAVLPEEMSFDVVLLNVVLHHCIADSVSATRALQQRVLEQAAARLRPGGTLLVLEQIHQSPVFPEFASWLIFVLTRSKLVARVVKSLGANTAGVGVLFFSERRLLRLFRDAGLSVSQAVPFRKDPRSWQQYVLAFSDSYQTLYSLTPVQSPSTA